MIDHDIQFHLVTVNFNNLVEKHRFLSWLNVDFETDNSADLTLNFGAWEQIMAVADTKPMTHAQADFISRTENNVRMQLGLQHIQWCQREVIEEMIEEAWNDRANEPRFSEQVELLKESQVELDQLLKGENIPEFMHTFYHKALQRGPRTRHQDDVIESLNGIKDMAEELIKEIPMDNIYCDKTNADQADEIYAAMKELFETLKP
jgi:hypothetical protein